MSREAYETISYFVMIYRTLAQLVVLFLIWKILFKNENKRARFILFGALTLLNFIFVIAIDDSKLRYLFSVVIILAYIFWQNRKMWQEAVFSMLTLYFFHSSAYLLANCVYQYALAYGFSRLDVYSPDYMSQMYMQTGLGLVGMILLHSFLMIMFYLIFRKIMKNPPSISCGELVFLSVINVVEIVFTYMVIDLSMVKLENEVFVLFEAKRSMYVKIPVMVVLMMIGEFSLIAVWKNYRNTLRKWQQSNVMEEQLKRMKRRYEEADAVYSNVRKAQHEMRNHMANIRGLVACGNYSDVDSYIEKMDEAVRKLDLKISTGSTLCDVIINDKASEAERLSIDFDVNFKYQENDFVSTFDLGIILSNLLDNAIEACQKVDEGGRFVRLELSNKGKFILIKVENSYDGNLVWNADGKLPVSSKLSEKMKSREVNVSALSEHGLGLKNVSELADKYFGGVQIETEDEVFRITVMLQW
jgi:sensor histidine kinase YesM